MQAAAIPTSPCFIGCFPRLVGSSLCISQLLDAGFWYFSLLCNGFVGVCRKSCLRQASRQLGMGCSPLTSPGSLLSRSGHRPFLAGARACSLIATLVEMLVLCRSPQCWGMLGSATDSSTQALLTSCPTKDWRSPLPVLARCLPREPMSLVRQAESWRAQS